MTPFNRSTTLGAPPRTAEPGLSARISRLDARTPGSRTPGLRTPASRIPGLDGLRALAVLAVIAYHLGPGVLPGGFIGVDVFFVISGFLITSLLLREHEVTGRIDLGAFWKRRARRLLPALGIVLAGCGAAALLIGGNPLIGLGAQLIGATTFSSNWVSVAQGTSYFSETSPELFRNLWSLAVEEQFYLVWPIAVLVITLLRGRAARAAAAVLIAVASSVAMAVLFTGGDATRVYYGTDTHSFGLAIGAAYAFARMGAKPVRGAAALPPGLGAAAWRAAGAVLSVASVASFAALFWMSAALTEDDPLVYRGGLGLASVLSLVVIAEATRAESVVTALLDARVLRWIGDRSYGLYLWHWPVFVLVVEALPGWARTGGSGWALAGVAAAIAVVASEVSYRAFETPIRRLGFRGAARRAFAGLRSTPIRIAATVVAATVLTASIGMTATALTMDPGRSDAEARIAEGLKAVEDAEASPSPSPQDAPGESAIASRPGDSPQSIGAATPPTGAEIIAIGDSVMLAAAPQLQEQFPGIAIDATVSRQMRQAPDIVRGLLASGSLRPVVVIGLGTNGPVARDTLEEVRELAGADRTVVFVTAQAPRGWVPGVNAELGWIAERYRDVELADWHNAIAPQLDVLASDQVHPGPTGGRIYSGAIAAALERHAGLRPALDPGDYGLAPRAV